ncbi:MAG: class I tRNA ligase family protein [Deltaproteobacteria bacterium]|nr:class I tRNA ligase family protein [Deltaproteobacteria bacterium]
MLKLYNSLGKKLEPFVPVNDGMVTMFTCGPSVYQRAHIGNFRTFLFEDVLVRYLAYLGCVVTRGMNFTDIEDKAIAEARKEDLTVKELTDRNSDEFLGEMKLLRIRIPEYLPRASEHVAEAAAMVKELIALGVAYRHGGNVYFDPLKFPGFGKLYGLDMSRWPAKKRRFHKDTYPGIQWNRGDFILWHGARPGDSVFWETPLGRGRPSWNIQDPSMVAGRFQETLSIYCGGIDNLYRHHDYSLAILESLRPYPMARFWLHGEHLFVGGKKMSKSRGNLLYTSHLLDRGYAPAEIRFFLIDGHYRERLSYTDGALGAASAKLKGLREGIRRIAKRAGAAEPRADERTRRLKETFREAMDEDLAVRRACDGLAREMAAAGEADPGSAAALIEELRRIDRVLQVLF